MALRGLYTIPPRYAFVDSLARGLLATYGEDPLDFAGALILVPTRRAVRALRDAFLRVGGGRPLLLPRIRPIGDVDADESEAGLADEAAPELAPAIDKVSRESLLARLVETAHPRIAATPGGPASPAPTPAQSLRLARELAALLDELQVEGVSFDRLDTLVPAEHAEHWQRTLTFLGILRGAWPALLAERGLLDPMARRGEALRALAARWTARAPAHPVIAAGSTGSQPATRALLAAIADLPAGCVVLPGLDTELDEKSWDKIDETHPQFVLRELLTGLERNRHEVKIWPGDADTVADGRALLLSEVMRPAATTDLWRGAPPLDTASLAHVTRIDCPTPQAEAVAVALVLREALERPGRTAALVTPDRGLARRVAAELGRWGIDIDDSAGVPLAETPAAALLRLIAAMVVARFAPAATLAVLQHPFCGLGQARVETLRLTRRLDAVVRGPKPEAGLAGLRDAVVAAAVDDGFTPPLPADIVASLLALLDRLDAATAPLRALDDGARHPQDSWLRALVSVAEAIAATDVEPGADGLWRGEAGETLATAIANLIESGGEAPPVAASGWPDLFDELLAGVVVRPRFGPHPRLAIWGPLEARLQRADRVVLGGLNEGVWPGAVDSGPWLSRPMRRDMGLPQPERRIGQAAHDFAQAFAADEVFLTRGAKVEGAQSVPARWLARLDARLGYDGSPDATVPDYILRGRGWLDVALRVDRPASVVPNGRPSYAPPIAARPTKLSASALEQWRRDPYGLYARRILGLYALDDLETPFGPAERGTALHAVFERFLLECREGVPADGEARMRAFGREMVLPKLRRPSERAFWWPRFERLADWFVANERTRRDQDWQPLLMETKGEMTIGPVTFTAVADRIDHDGAGTWEIVDYKTGRVATKREIEALFSPQLPLEYLIARAGGYSGKIGGGRPDEVHVVHWQVGGTGEGGKVIPVADGEHVAAALEEILARDVAAYYEAGVPYVAIPDPAFAPGFNDYAHLERQKEWLHRDDDDQESGS